MFVASLLLAATLQAGPERAITRAPQDASPYDQQISAISVGDESSLVLWTEGGVTHPLPSRPRSLLAIRIATDGKRIDASPIVIAQDWFHSSAVTRAGDRWLVVWQTGSETKGLFVDDDGTTGDVMSIAPGVTGSVHLATSGTRLLLVWMSDAISALPLDMNAKPIGPVKVLDQHDTYVSLDIATRKEGFEIVWVRHWADQRYTVEALRVDYEATPLAYRWLDRTEAQVFEVEALVDSDELVALWTTSQSVFYAREGEPLRVVSSRATINLLEIDGKAVAVVGSDTRLGFIGRHGSMGDVWISSHIYAANPLKVAWTGQRLLVAFSGKSLINVSVEHDLFTTVLDSSFRWVASERLTFDPSLQTAPNVARNAHGEAMAVWIETSIEGKSDLRANRLDALGRRVEHAAPPRFPADPAARTSIASDGENYLVVHGDAVYHLSRDGVFSTKGFGLAAYLPLLHTCATWNGNEYLVAYHRLYDSSQQGRAGDVRIAHVTRDGQITADDRLSDKVLESPLACASTDTTSLFAWGGGDTVHAALVSDGGTISAPFLVGSGRRFAVAARADRFAVAMTSSGVITRATVSTEGTVMIANGSTVEGTGDVAIAATRDGFMLAWGNGDLYAQELDIDAHPTGTVIALSTEPGTERNVVLAGGETPFAMYMRDVKPHLDPRWRIFTRTLTRGAERVRAVRP
jgi:hypothetical protein